MDNDLLTLWIGAWGLGEQVVRDLISELQAARDELARAPGAGAWGGCLAGPAHRCRLFGGAQQEIDELHDELKEAEETIRELRGQIAAADSSTTAVDELARQIYDMLPATFRVTLGRP